MNEVFNVALDTVLHESELDLTQSRKSLPLFLLYGSRLKTMIGECSDMDRASALAQKYLKDLNEQDFIKEFRHFKGQAARGLT